MTKEEALNLLEELNSLRDTDKREHYNLVRRIFKDDLGHSPYKQTKEDMEEVIIDYLQTCVTGSPEMASNAVASRLEVLVEKAEEARQERSEAQLERIPEKVVEDNGMIRVQLANHTDWTLGVVNVRGGKGERVLVPGYIAKYMRLHGMAF